MGRIFWDIRAGRPYVHVNTATRIGLVGSVNRFVTQYLPPFRNGICNKNTRCLCI